jgi:trans-2,3-dihydro-3-hydroxyanthranilate isomerase
VHDADGVEEETMLRFARETRLSETTFVQSASVEGADYRNRIWTIGGEVPFAGHPSLGTAVAVARRRGEREARYVQQTLAGLQPVDVVMKERYALASVLQEPAVFGAELERDAVMAALGLDPDVADRARPPQLVTTGLDTLIAPIAEPAALGRVHPDLASICALAGQHELNVYVVWIDPEADHARARMFGTNVAGGEDPATGSAAGPLCAYLAERDGRTRIEIEQGVEMGRASRLSARLEGERVRVGGGVVAIVDGTLAL